MSTKSTSRWGLCWILALLLVVSGVIVFERHWRAKAYWPTVMDSIDLWAQKRDRVVSNSATTQVALLGASRIQFGVYPDVFRDEVRRLGANVEVSMLAINGHYPLASLRDLASDERFTGIALVGVDSRGLQKLHREMQAKWPQYYRHEWTPAKNLHRTLLTQLQPHLIATRPDFSWSNLTVRQLDGHGPPNREYVTFRADRSGGTDYAKSDIPAVRDARARELEDYYAHVPAISAQQWLDDNDVVIEWVKQINSRGGRVVFYREPVSGVHLSLDEARFPRHEFWDRLARRMPATMIDFRDYEALNIATPDTSHIDAKDIERHTRALVRVLAEKRVFAKLP
jgi:hypothetical protein